MPKKSPRNIKVLKQTRSFFLSGDPRCNIEVPISESSVQDNSDHVFESTESKDDFGIHEDCTSPKHHVRNTIRRMGSQQSAESLRTVYLDLGYNTDCLAKPAEFHLYEAIKSLIYELLPPVFLAPLACMLLEPSVSAGYNVAVHHNVAVGLNLAEYSSTSFTIVFFRDFTVNWLCESSVLLWLATRPKSVDPVELALCYSWMFTRYCVIAAKYGYYSENMIEDNRKAVRHPEWHLSTLIIVNWGCPSFHMLRESVERAQQITNVDLGAVSFVLNPEQCTYYMEELRKYHAADYNYSTTASMELQGELTVEDVLLQIVVSSFQDNKYGGAVLAELAMLLTATCLPGFVRLYYGFGMFGDSSESVIVTIYVGMWISHLLGMTSCLMFMLVSADDLHRRKESNEKMMSLVEYPGLPFASLFPCRDEEVDEGAEDVETEKTPEYLFIDINHGGNCYSWSLCRRVLKNVGENYYRRILVYIEIIIISGIAASLFINAIVWMKLPHHIASMAAIFVDILTLFFSCVRTLKQAQMLQETIPSQRLILKRKLVALSQEIVASTSGPCDRARPSDDISSPIKREKLSGGKRSFQHLVSLRDMITNVDKLIAYEEEEADPCSIFGVTAGPGMVSAVFGIIGGLLTIAFQQALQNGIYSEYQSDGWFR